MANIFGKMFDWNGVDVTPTSPVTKVDVTVTGGGGAGGSASVGGSGLAFAGNNGYTTTGTTTYTLGGGTASWSNTFTGNTWTSNVGDLVINRPGKPPLAVADTLDQILKRLSILQADFEKMEKYPALKEAYDNYKLIEALCHEEDDK